MSQPNTLLELKQKILAAFQCQQTGNCCKKEGVVYATGPELEAMAAYLNMPLADFLQKFVVLDNGWRVLANTKHRPNCFLNDSKGCSIYPVRPKACKTYPDWPEIWGSMESIVYETTVCKGLKKAFDEVAGNED